MERFHLEKSIFGGSDVYDENGNRVGYSLPGILGDGEDFYAMDGRPVGQSFESALGGEAFTGVGDGRGSFGFMDREFLMGRNAYLHGNPFGTDGRDSGSGSPTDPWNGGTDFGPDAGGGPDAADGFGPGGDW